MVLTAFFIGFALDLAFGDPRTSVHPVCIIGRWVNICESVYRRIFGKHEVVAGVFTVITVLLLSTLIPCVILWAAYRLNTAAGVAVEAVLCYSMLAVRDLKEESMRVYYALKEEGLCAGRRAVSMIVGRDTDRLDEKGVVRAAVETIAENFSDGVAAPMFYMAIGGAGLMYFYKVVNTMDSMIGYKNNRYYYFGRAAARLDDVMNFVPSRIAAVIMVTAAFFTGLDVKNSVRIFRRDRHNHTSPNSAQTEAVAAGALGVRLAGDAWYFGELYHKQTIGDAHREIEAEDIVRMNRLMYVSAFLALIIFGGVRLCICMAVMSAAGKAF